MKVQNKDNKGNPYHSDANGQFTSKDGDGVVNNNEELGDINFTAKDGISPNFKPKMSDDEYLSWLDSLDLFDDEEVIEEQIENTENVLKSVMEMTQEELITEIGQHQKFLIEKGLDLSKFNDFCAGDLKLKCINLRQMEKIMKKYPVNLTGCKFVNSHHYKSSDGSMAYMRSSFSRTEFFPNTQMNFNAKYFCDYNYVHNFEKREAELGWWVEKDEDNYVVSTFNHEYGHAICNEIFTKAGVYTKELVDSLYEEALEDCLEDDEYGNVVVVYRNKRYPYSSRNQAIIAKKVLNTKIKQYRKDFFKKIKNEIISQYYDGSIKESRSDTSKYGSRNVFEWFAETFSSLEGGKPTKSALALGKWLKEKGYMVGE